MASSSPRTSSEDNHRPWSQTRGRTQTPPPRPTTPLRPPSRSSLRSSATPSYGPSTTSEDPIASLEPAFAEFSDSMADLEANFMHLQLLHESLARFNECFSSFLYGLNVNAYCVNFEEAPVGESYQKLKSDPRFMQQETHPSVAPSPFSRRRQLDTVNDGDETFISTDTSFVENPPSAIKPSIRSHAPPPTNRIPSGSNARGARGGRGGSTAPSIRGSTGQRGRGSGLARASTRGRGGSRT